MRPTLYALVALLSSAAACHGPIAQVQWSYVDAPRTFDNLVVYERIQGDARVGVLFRGFETRVQEQLEACRVHTTLRHGLPDADTVDRASADAAGAPADTSAASGNDAVASTGANESAEQARLTVVPWGGTATRVWSRSDEDITTMIDGSFKLELYDARVKKVVWRAVIDIKTRSTPEMSDGREFADTVLARMRRDHVIRCSD